MTAYLISCENATCAVPEAYREIFRGSEDVVASAEGWEPGSLNLAQGFAMRFRTPLVHGDVTRLLLDFAEDGDARWSRFAMKLPEATRLKIVDRHERPYRTQITQRIAEDLRRHSAVVHLMVHTEDGSEGQVTLQTPPGGGLSEKIASAWQARLQASDLDVCHLRNTANHAWAASLSRNFPADQYAQIRFSVSQTFFLEGRPWRWETLKKLLLESLAQVVAEVAPPSARESPSTDPR